MARLTVGKGLQLTIQSYKNLSGKLSGIIKRSVYPVAGDLAGKITKELKNLPVVDGKDGLPPYAPKGYKLNSISSVQRKDLLNGFGISRFKNENGFINVKMGFDGYGSYKTKKHPHGIPNALLIRSLCKGTDFLKRNDFISRTYRANEKRLEKDLESYFNDLIRREL